MRQTLLQPKNVQHIPDHLEEGVLYISERFNICSHLCACGCKEEVVTPLSKAEWRIFRDGDLVSLLPSIGNWNYSCQSHYFIEQNRIRWLPGMTAQKIERVQKKDALDLQRLLDQGNASPKTDLNNPSPKKSRDSKNKNGGNADEKSAIRRLAVKLKNFFN